MKTTFSFYLFFSGLTADFFSLDVSEGIPCFDCQVGGYLLFGAEHNFAGLETLWLCL